MTRLRLIVLTAIIGFGVVVSRATQLAAQNPPSTSPDSLEKSFATQARSRFEQASAEVSRASWLLLSQSIGRGVSRLRDDGPTTERIAQARQSLNTIVDWMIEAADTTSGGRVVGETSFTAAMRKCSPPKYPFCP
jgi:hypothetical protein